MRRPRLYWCDWEVLEQSRVTVKESAEWKTLQLESPQVKVKNFLKPGEGVSESFKAFPCFMQSIPRKAPPFRPAGIDSCEQEDLDRWKAAAYRCPPYQYKKQNLVQCRKTKRWYPPEVEVREELLGCRRDHTFECMPMKDQAVAVGLLHPRASAGHALSAAAERMGFPVRGSFNERIGRKSQQSTGAQTSGGKNVGDGLCEQTDPQRRRDHAMPFSFCMCVNVFGTIYNSNHTYFV